MLYFSSLALGIMFGLAIAAATCGIAMSRAIVHALQSMARQPELSGSLQTSMIIGLAFIESLTIYTLVIAFMLFAKLPETSKILELIAK